MNKHDAEELSGSTDKSLKYLGIVLGVLLGCAIGYFSVQLFKSIF